ncbi:MAG: CoB--CoM heterodisulfide reductase iron-sulfur subunit B family protein [bacterium]
MQYGYYPGCSIHSGSKEYGDSLSYAIKPFDIKLEEIKGWTCCVPVAPHCCSSSVSIALAADNLAKAEKQGYSQVVAPCAACFSRLKVATYEIKQDKQLQETVSQTLGYEFRNSVAILHPLELFPKKIEHCFITRDLSRINVVCYYGCLLTRPPKIKQFDDAENPQTMDNILTDIGMNVLDWSYKTDCCGASYTLPKKEIVFRLTKQLLDNARQSGANCISVACPLCHLNLELVQWELKEYHLPVFYFTQLIGLAYGLSAKELGLNRHLIKVDKVLGKIK